MCFIFGKNEERLWKYNEDVIRNRKFTSEEEAQPRLFNRETGSRSGQIRTIILCQCVLIRPHGLPWAS